MIQLGVMGPASKDNFIKAREPADLSLETGSGFILKRQDRQGGMDPQPAILPVGMEPCDHRQ